MIDVEGKELKGLKYGVKGEWVRAMTSMVGKARNY